MQDMNAKTQDYLRKLSLTHFSRETLKVCPGCMSRTDHFQLASLSPICQSARQWRAAYGPKNKAI